MTVVVTLCGPPCAKVFFRERVYRALVDSYCPPVFHRTLRRRPAQACQIMHITYQLATLVLSPLSSRSISQSRSHAHDPHGITLSESFRDPPSSTSHRALSYSTVQDATHASRSFTQITITRNSSHTVHTDHWHRAVAAVEEAAAAAEATHQVSCRAQAVVAAGAEEVAVAAAPSRRPPSQSGPY